MSKRILVVDDDLAVRESLAQVLAMENYEPLLAADARQALEILRQEEPDLVLLDITMPGKNGWDLFEKMEKLYPLVPVIIITAKPNQQGRATGYGADALMEKPLDLPLLLNTIAQLLAETPSQRLARLTNPKFVTPRLGHEYVH